ncbi:hypothetical protein [Xanthomonas bromi]|uniref:hypothetical protein n=1 Tax=Xanthomonas bromi TaxID=56449 RepID=UPI001111EFD9|nr:hypothetical protein [Xanthomonas bromi]
MDSARGGDAGRLAGDVGRLDNPAKRGLTSEPRRDLSASLSLRWSFSAARELEEELLDPNNRPIRRTFFSSFKSWGAYQNTISNPCPGEQRKHDASTETRVGLTKKRSAS